MSEELGKRLKKAFLNRKSGGTAAETSCNTELLPGERRDVAVLFLDLSGFTAFSETLDHETVHEITRSLMDELVYTAEQYSGYVDKIEGDRIMILFGAIRSRENNSRSAILCGFKMLRVIEVAGSILSEAGVHLSARIGINSGPVTVAPDAIGHLTAMGRTVNIASRMEENSEENCILVTDSVYNDCSESILWGKPVELSIRGVGIPLVSWKPLSVNYGSSLISCHESVNTVFVAREKQYAQLNKLRAIQHGRSSGVNRRGGAKHLIAELAGEAGTGKTRLVSEFLKNNTADCIVLRGNSIPDAQPAHWLWSAVLQNLLNIHEDSGTTFEDFVRSISRFCPVKKLEGGLPFLGRLVSAVSNDIRLQQLGNKAIALETKMALRDLIETLSENSPVVVVLEDLQWMDSTDAEALDFIVKNCNSVNPVIFLLVRRSDHRNLLPADICNNSAYSTCSQIVLDEFEKQESHQFTQAFLEKLNETGSYPVSSNAMDFIHRHSSGNPFFLQELLLHLVESGGLSVSDDEWILTDNSVELSTPESLTGLLQSRLDRLPEKLRKTLLNCSVFGMEFSYDLYRKVVNRLGLEPSDRKVFDDLVERQFLEKSITDSGVTYIFHHSFIQNTAYNSILSHNLKLLHRAVARSMEEIFVGDSERVSAKLAEHWERAGEESSAVKWAIVAQKHASQNYQYEAVLKWGNKLDSWLSPLENDADSLEKLLGVLRRTGLVLQYTHRWEELHSLLKRALQVASDNNLTEWTAEIELATGSYFTSVRKIDEASAHLHTSLEICHSNNLEETQSDVLSSLGVIAGIRRDFAMAGEYFQQAKELFVKHGDRRGEAKALGNLGILRRNIGETHTAAALLEEVLVIFREIGDVRGEAVTLGNLGSMYHDRKDSEKAEVLFKKAIKIFRKLGERMPEGIFLCNLGNALRNRKLFEKADESYFDALDIMEEIGDRRTAAWITTNLGLLRLAEERYEDSLKFFTDAVSTFTEIGDTENQAISLAGRGYLEYLCSRTEQAYEDYMKATEIITKLKLPQMEFNDTFIELNSRLSEDSSITGTIPWPEHWEQTNG